MARFGFARMDRFCRKILARRGTRTTTRSEVTDADHQPAHSQAAGYAACEKEGAGFAAEPAKTRRLHPRLHHDAEEAELRAAQSRQGPADQRLRSHRLYPGRGP